ncbi:S-layer homology domain-containing protein [uncultured Dialister sp.]|uniref:S-layer homology domain-containing protein n=1 Tax=uncultured Dialister sp. TaxID=278064 RepID=UPI0025890330|nr:S-layer homology domain-containing protein [uncultured Dialister sp.]
MRHTILRAAVCAFFAGAAMTASAANPFSDVESDSWAYEAVASLSDRNIIEGYPDGTFRGNKHITRYELAQITARLLAKKDSLTAEQQSIVDKLSREYANDLSNLGVRISELEKKTGKTFLITELRVQGIDRYDNIFTEKKEKHYELGARVRLNTITRVNDRSTLYGQLETFISMNGREMFDPNKYTYHKDGSMHVAGGHNDGDVHLNRLLATYQFGPKQDTSNLPFGPSKNLIGIGQFPVKMGVTGYTYDGEFKGAFLKLGDYLKGHQFTFAFGRATNISVNYTAPMMHGVKVTPIAKSKLIGELSTNKVVAAAVAADPSLKAILGQAKNLINSSNNLPELKTNLNTIVGAIGSKNPALASAVAAKLGALNLDALAGGSMVYNPATDTLYPMGKDVMMDWGEDEDVPVTYASYIYKIPDKWEVHAYAMKANGPVGHICEAYGFAGSYYVTPKWNIHGEFVKNLRVLPLNNEKPHSFNYGFSYGTADVLKPKSFSIGIDYIYSQAGTYFGGSGNDIADQYMGHVYKNWHGMKNVPAYFADKMDALTDGNPANDHNNFGGAKFFLAKASYVPMKGLIVEADYGFKAKDMGGKKMDNMLMLKATAYIK